ncbi:MAG: phosphodiester glycosidase family protein [Oscillospiraceae bacterium]|nr:phosphodiester glycosidase family protein [Oscillospiraceae bacterium]
MKKFFIALLVIILIGAAAVGAYYCYPLLTGVLDSAPEPEPEKLVPNIYTDTPPMDVPTALPIDFSGGSPANIYNLTKTSYEDESIKIDIKYESYNNQRCYYAYVEIAHPSQLRTAFSGGSYDSKVRETVSQMAKRQQAVLAINSDFCNYRKDGIIIRQAQLYRNKPSYRDVLMIDADGDFIIKKEKEEGFNAEKFHDEHMIFNSFSFGPALIIDGVRQKIPGYYEEGIIHQPAARAAIGQLGHLKYLILLVDGQQDDYDGLTVSQVAALMEKKGCTQAYNLDGGQSAVMLLNNRVINSVALGGEKRMSDCIYFASTRKIIERDRRFE